MFTEFQANCAMVTDRYNAIYHDGLGHIHQVSLLAAVSDNKRDSLLSLVGLSTKYNISRTTLQRACNNEGSGAALLKMSTGRDRKTKLSADEEKLVADSVLESQRIDTPLTRETIRDFAQTFIMTLLLARRQVIGFKDDDPVGSG
eukprot:IDg10764t1